MATLLWQLDGENFPSEMWWIYCVTARNQFKMDGVHRIEFLKENFTPRLMNLAPSFFSKILDKKWSYALLSRAQICTKLTQIPPLEIFSCCQSEKPDEAEAPLNQGWEEEAIYCDFSLKWLWQCCRYKGAGHRRFLPSGCFNSVKFSSILPSIIAWLLPLSYFLGKFLGLHVSLPGCKYSSLLGARKNPCWNPT